MKSFHLERKKKRKKKSKLSSVVLVSTLTCLVIVVTVIVPMVFMSSRSNSITTDTIPKQKKPIGNVDHNFRHRNSANISSNNNSNQIHNEQNHIRNISIMNKNVGSNGQHINNLNQQENIFPKQIDPIPIKNKMDNSVNSVRRNVRNVPYSNNQIQKKQKASGNVSIIGKNNNVRSNSVVDGGGGGGGGGSIPLVRNQSKTSTSTCLGSLSELTPEERFPTVGRRHMVQPPLPKEEHPDVLVCCRTTAGDLSIMVRPSWAPLGAQRFLELVLAQEYFSSKVALMRCVSNFICQFGLAGNPALTKKYSTKLKDDVNWLPEGPKYRTNAQGVKRFARGYLAYAGSGKDSRGGNQFIVALADNGPLGGGSPWEVPWGEVVGKTSFETLASIYTGYGENGPNQGFLRREGSSPRVAQDFPKLDYITDCHVVE